jgi:hypothetical protein
MYNKLNASLSKLIEHWKPVLHPARKRLEVFSGEIDES